MKKANIMSKKKLSTILISFVVVLAMIFSMGFVSTIRVNALHDNAENYPFNPLRDFVFEDFSRTPLNVPDEIAGGNLREVDINSEVIDSGANFFRARIAYHAPTPLYAMALTPFATQIRENFIMGVRMRLPFAGSPVTTDNIILGLRCGNNLMPTTLIPLSEVSGMGGMQLPQLTTEWQNFYIDLDYTFNGVPAPNNTNLSLDSVVGFHFFGYGEEVFGYDVDIQSIFLRDPFDAERRVYLNRFQGASPLESARLELGAYWTNSNPYSVIISRTFTMEEDGMMTIINRTAPQGFEFAVIESEQYLGNIYAEYSTNGGTTWSTAVPLIHDAFAIGNGTNAIRIENRGAEEVVIDRVFLTNFPDRPISRVFPNIDPTSVRMIDNFRHDQEILRYGMQTYQPTDLDPTHMVAGRFFHQNVEMTPGLDPRSAASIRNGILNLNPNIQGHNETFTGISFTMKPNYLVPNGLPRFEDYSYIVFRLRTLASTGLETFRFSFEGAGSEVYMHGLRAGFELPSHYGATIDQNPYRQGAWTYVVVNIAETFHIQEGVFGGSDALMIFWSGDAALDIDSIFFANSIDTRVVDESAIGGYAVQRESEALIATMLAENVATSISYANSTDHRFLKFEFEGLSIEEINQLGFDLIIDNENYHDGIASFYQDSNILVFDLWDIIPTGVTNFESILIRHEDLSTNATVRVSTFDHRLAHISNLTPAIQTHEVINAINAIPVVSALTLGHRAQVETARALYNALATNLRPNVTNRDALTTLEARLVDLDAIQNVINEINSLPAVGELTIEDGVDVRVARYLFNQLREELRSEVSNLATLIAAESRIYELENPAGEGCKSMSIATYSAIASVVILLAGALILILVLKKKKENN